MGGTDIYCSRYCFRYIDLYYPYYSSSSVLHILQLQVACFHSSETASIPLYFFRLLVVELEIVS